MNKQHWKQPDQPFYVERIEDASGQTMYQAHLRDGSFDTSVDPVRETVVTEILNYVDNLKKGK